MKGECNHKFHLSDLDFPYTQCLALYLEGAFVNDESNAGNVGTDAYPYVLIDKRFHMDGNRYASITSLQRSRDPITDADMKTVSIVDLDGTTYA